MALIKEEIEVKYQKVFDFLIEKHRQNPELRFLLRRINKGEKLNKGFWFYGDDTHLDVSFWNVWENFIVSMGFRVYSNGKSEIFFKGKDNENKAKIFNKLANTLGGFEQVTQSNNTKKAKKGEQTPHWHKRLEGEDYLKNLVDFITFDVPVINSILKREDKDGNLFPFITKEKFDVSLAKIQDWQSRIISNEPALTEDQNAPKLSAVLENSVKLLGISLNNIKRFSEEHIALDRQIICFYGKNGTGKTTLLRSIVIAIAGANNLDSSKKELRNLVKIRGVSKDKTSFIEEAKLELSYTVGGMAEVDNSGDRKNYNAVKISYKSLNDSLKIENDDKINGTDDIDPMAFKLYGEELDLFKTLIVGFAQQGKNEVNRESKQVLRPYIDDFKNLIYDTPDSCFEDFNRWVVEKLDPDPTKGGSLEERLESRKQINEIFEIISKITDDGMALLADSNKAIITNTSNPNGIPLLWMSQGYKNVIGWVGFFMKRIREVAEIELEADENFMDMPAICLIDEIDTYLHPKWQYHILSVLSETFKNVHFIVTSHSPFVLSSIPQEKILLYQLIEEDGEIIIKEETKNLYGAQINDVAKEMGTTKRFGKVNGEVEGLLKKVFNNDTEGAREDLAKLETEINYEDSDLRKAATLIKSKEMFNQRSK